MLRHVNPDSMMIPPSPSSYAIANARQWLEEAFGQENVGESLMPAGNADWFCIRLLKVDEALPLMQDLRSVARRMNECGVTTRLSSFDEIPTVKDRKIDHAILLKLARQRWAIEDSKAPGTPKRNSWKIS